MKLDRDVVLSVYDKTTTEYPIPETFEPSEWPKTLSEFKAALSSGLYDNDFLPYLGDQKSLSKEAAARFITDKLHNFSAGTNLEFIFKSFSGVGIVKEKKKQTTASQSPSSKATKVASPLGGKTGVDSPYVTFLILFIFQVRRKNPSLAKVKRRSSLNSRTSTGFRGFYFTKSA